MLENALILWSFVKMYLMAKYREVSNLLSNASEKKVCVDFKKEANVAEGKNECT